MYKLFGKGVFYLRFKIFKSILNAFRVGYWKMLGIKIGKGSSLSKIYITWPHKVSVGNKCIIEHNVFFKHDGVYSEGQSIVIGDNTFIGNHVEFNISQKINIGNNCLIAAGCKFVDHDHGMDKLTMMKSQECIKSSISVADDVWIGANAVILKGITIEKGAVLAAGAVLNRSIPAYEIWGGIPAKKLGERK